ncbi:MAG: NAD(P)/FAD-dependent oxidoreductase [Microthrixaceae bacterium]|nr:NAD(P)/FAD-dependent oxidoreductase [Microthrixaceae bacterium]
MTTPEHFDVVVVGAGISGIGAAYHLQTLSPDRSFVMLEGRDDLGGTWDLFRYPGVRSDSDMHTLGYSFKPWKAERCIADGPSILEYLNETVDENNIRPHIRFRTLVERADWSSEDARWTVTARRRTGAEEGGGGDAEVTTYTCSFLFMCSGYYSYKAGHTPEFPGRDRFGGTVVHPQQWPDDLDYAGKRVVIIGSGATAVTLVPSMAATAEHVTMLQRSPTYVVSRPAKDALANAMRKVLPEQLAYNLTRWKNSRLQEFVYRKTRTDPDKVKARLLGMVRAELGEDYDVETHFTPSYNPWDQRLCLIPDSDLFKAIRSGAAEVVTDHIETFTETGIELVSGRELPADVIVTATGLELVTLGEVDFTVDGEQVNFSDTWTYKGLAYSDVPNLVSSFGYINASWTLRADLTCAYVCRLLNHLRDTGTDIATPRLRPSDADMPARPWIDDFSSGYIQRMIPFLPKQGDRAPWLNTQRYSEDKKLIVEAPIDDGVMTFTTARVPEAVAAS